MFFFSSAETVVILSHLSKHIQYVRSTTSYLLASARKNGDMLDSRMEHVQSESLVNEIENAVEAADALQQDIHHLHTEVICVSVLQLHAFFEVISLFS